MINVLVDLGNYNVKFLGENKGMFSSKYSTRFNANGDIFERIEIDGEVTYIGTGEFEREYNKIDKNYLPQLFYALSNATSQSDINLCLLLPVAQMAQKDKLISRLQNNSFSFKINGEHRLININKVAVLAEGVVGFYGLQDRDKDTLVIDIGGRTVNYAVFINGRPDKNFTEKIGVFDLYTIIKDYENAKGKNYIEEEIERLIKNGRIKVEPKVYLSFLKDILNRTKSRINITDYEVVFVGGGASLLKVYIEANTPGIVCEDSIFANLNGAQKLCEVMWRGN